MRERVAYGVSHVPREPLCEYRTKCSLKKTRCEAHKAKRAGHRCPTRFAMQDPP